ncbi:MAG: protease modulator HflC [Anaerohalosphaera sp.]|nr:protease modulator HflC [Anaerohalosphaera sp.]
MKNASIIILVALVAVVFGLYLVSFQVRETEVAMVTRFGKTVREISEPGFYWQLPKPIEKVHRFDSRNQYLQGRMEEPPTSSGDPIVVTTYAIWKIKQPKLFFNSLKEIKEAKIKLESLLRNSQNEVIGSHSWGEFVNVDPSMNRLAQIEAEIEEAARQEALDEYGIEIVEVGFKQMGVTEQVTKDVFERMKADRKRRTIEILADGKSLADTIKDSANAKRTELLSIVTAEAKAIMGSGDAEAAKYYKELDADPEFAMFLRNIESLKNILKAKSTIVLGADTEPFELLRGIEKAEPK